MQDMLALIWILVAVFCVVEELDRGTYTGEKRMNQLFIVFCGIAATIVAEAAHTVLNLI